jgi:hypothetical protein
MVALSLPLPITFSAPLRTHMNPKAIDQVDARSHLHALEQRLIALPGPWDQPERQVLWHELASLNAQLGRWGEAAIYWLNALWEADHPQALVERWVRWELGNVDEITNELIALAGLSEEPTERQAQKWAALLLWAASRDRLPPRLDDRGVLEQFERLESAIPLRAVWLVWRGLARHLPDVAQRLPGVAARVLRRLETGIDSRVELPGCVHAAGTRFQILGDWLLHLHDLSQGWVEAQQGESPGTSQTPAYVRLLFAFGLACLGRSVPCLKLREQAAAVLASGDEAHIFLLNAYGYRIDQALEGRGLGGPLPQDVTESCDHMRRMSRYVMERLREHSLILEPDQRIDAHQHWKAMSSDVAKALVELTELADCNEIVNRIDMLLRKVPKGSRGSEMRARILRAGLEAAPRVGEDFARSMLDQTVPAYDALSEPKERGAQRDQATFLEKAIFVAGHFGLLESVHPLMTRFQRTLDAQQGAQVFQLVERVAPQVVRTLRKLGMRDEIDQTLRHAAELIMRGRDIKASDFKKEERGQAALRSLLQVAAGWYTLGRDSQAEPIVQAARAVLLANDLHSREQTALACAYAGAIGQGPVETGQVRLEEIFQRVGGVRDTFTTNKSHFGLYQLEVIEAVVLAVVSDQGLAQQQLSRWVDENEALIRRRIRHDLAVIAAGGFAL